MSESVNRQISVAYATILKSRLFDYEFYKLTYPDVANAGCDPLDHYLSYGEEEGRFPNSQFSADWYKKQYSLPDTSLGNALLHFATKGVELRLDPNRYFSTRFYISKYSDIANNADISEFRLHPLVHYMEYGSLEERETSVDFCTSAYLETYPNAKLYRYGALAHFIHIGHLEGCLCPPNYLEKALAKLSCCTATSIRPGTKTAAISLTQSSQRFREFEELVRGLTSNETAATLVEQVTLHLTSFGADAGMTYLCHIAFECDKIAKLSSIYKNIAMELDRNRWLENLSVDALVSLADLAARKFPTSTIEKANGILNALGIFDGIHEEWLNRVRDPVLIKLIMIAALHTRVDLIEILIAKFSYLVGMRLQDEHVYLNYFKTIDEILSKVGARCKSARNLCEPIRYYVPPTKTSRIAFITVEPHISGMRVPLAIIEGLKRTNPGLFTSVHVLRGSSAELSTQCRLLSCELIYYDNDANPRQFLDILFELKDFLTDNQFDAAVWTYHPWLCPLLFSIEVAPIQALLSQIFAVPVEAKDVKKFTLKGFDGRLITEGDNVWKTLPLSLYDLVHNEKEFRSEERAKLNLNDEILLGTISRPEKINSKEFLHVVCSLLKSNPNSRFLWTGLSAPCEINNFFHAEGVLSQTIFAGWVDPVRCTAALDIFLDSFPFASGMTVIQAMAMAKPVVSMRSPYTLIGRDIIEALEQPEKAPDIYNALRDAVGDLFENSFFPVAEDIESYVAISNSLILHAGLRQRVGAALQKVSNICYGDTVRLARFFQEHLDA